jgi:mannosyltransferase
VTRRSALHATTDAAAVLFLALCVAAALRRSLWMDELHSLFHARAGGVGQLLQGLRADNHPPLYFLALRACVRAFGDSALALRLPSIACGVATVVGVGRLAQRLPGRLAPFAASPLVACSSLLLTVSTEARMYSLLALCVVGTLTASLELLEQRGARSRLALAAWVTLGLHAHYFFLHYLLLLTLAWLVCARSADERRAARAALVALGLALLASLPWYLWGFREQLTGHARTPGGSVASLAHAFEALAHLLFYNVRLGGPLRPVFLGGAAAALLLAALGSRDLLHGERATRRLALFALLASVAVPPWAALVASLWPRAGFGWIYLAASSAPFALLAASQPQRSRLRVALLAFVALAALALSVLNASSPGTEDYRGAVGSIVARHRPGADGVIAIEPGPEFFGPAVGWRYYAPRLAGPGGAAPELVRLDTSHRLVDPGELDGLERVFVLERGLHEQFATLEELRALFADEGLESYGFNLRVHVFGTRRRP